MTWQTCSILVCPYYTLTILGQYSRKLYSSRVKEAKLSSTLRNKMRSPTIPVPVAPDPSHKSLVQDPCIIDFSGLGPSLDTYNMYCVGALFSDPE